MDVRNWILVVNTAGSISLLDTDTGITHGPYLEGQLGKVSGGNLFDVAVTPDGMTALVTAFNDSRVYFIDLTDLAAPTVLGSVDLGMFAEDVAVTADGKYALVTDGGFTTKVVVIDIEKRAATEIAEARDVYASSVTVAPAGTILTTSYFNTGFSKGVYQEPIAQKGGMVSTWEFDSTGHLAHFNDYQVFLRASGEVTTEPFAHAMRPVNVAVAPDGVTVLIPDVSEYTEDTGLDPQGRKSAEHAQYAVAVYLITAPGQLTFQRVITGLPYAAQSIAFDTTGTEAYLLGNTARDHAPPAGESGYGSDGLLVLGISAPGVVSFDPLRTADLRRISSSQYFGVDGLVAARGKVYATYSNNSASFPGLTKDERLFRVITMVDPVTLAVKRIATGAVEDGSIGTGPLGIALVPRREAAAAIPAGTATCAGFCGTANRDQGCFCDDDCAAWGDCCPDYAALCTGCDPATCTGGKKCTNQPGGTYACGCPAGYADDGAGTCVDVDECTAGTDNCTGVATCRDDDGGFTCVCPAGFVGDGAGGCKCKYGFRDDGAGGCVDVDECAENTHNCKAPAVCTLETSGGFTCECTAPLVQDGAGGCTCAKGYEEDGAGGCIDVDECARGIAACNGSATCRNEPGRYSCDCAPPLLVNGTGGCKCPTGYEEDGAGGCADIDECARGTATCTGSATCTNEPGQYSCVCTPPLVPDGSGGCMTAP